MSIFNQVVVGALPCVPRPVVRYFANRYIAGDSIADAIRCVRELNRDGKMATLDVLGEDVLSEEEVIAARDENINALQMIAKENVDSNLSIKLTSLGLKFGKDFCTENVRAILAEAATHNNFVRFDMEDSTCTSDTIEIFQHLQKQYPACGIVLQAYMRRSEADARELIRSRTNFRLCKGIYKEPPGIAFQDREEIRENFVRLLEMMFAGGCYVGIATHDAVLVERINGVIAHHGLARGQYEYQMLLGVQPELRQRLLAEGHRIRLYVPFGRSWYAFSMRRFKENPEIAGYILRAIFARKRTLQTDKFS